MTILLVAWGVRCWQWSVGPLDKQLICAIPAVLTIGLDNPITFNVPHAVHGHLLAE
jgi:hypothetical protein